MTVFFTYTIVPLLVFAPISIFINALVALWEFLTGVVTLAIQN